MRILLLFLFIFPADMKAQDSSYKSDVYKKQARKLDAESIRQYLPLIPSDTDFFHLIYKTYYYNPNYYPRHNISGKEAKFNTAKSILYALSLSEKLFTKMLESFLLSQTGIDSNSYVGAGIEKIITSLEHELQKRQSQLSQLDPNDPNYALFKNSILKTQDLLEKFKSFNKKHENLQKAVILILSSNYPEFLSTKDSDPKIYKDALRIIAVISLSISKISSASKRATSSVKELLAETYEKIQINYTFFVPNIIEKYKNDSFQESLFKSLIPNINSMLSKIEITASRLDEVFLAYLIKFGTLSNYKDDYPHSWEKYFIPIVAERYKEYTEADIMLKIEQHNLRKKRVKAFENIVKGKNPKGKGK